jgi:cytochrome c
MYSQGNCTVKYSLTGDNVMKRKSMSLNFAAVFFMLSLVGLVHATEKGTQEEAIAMVKKAVEYIKINGNEKAFNEITGKSSQFHDRDLYVVVYDMWGKCQAHGQRPNYVGKDMTEFKDPEGRRFMKERLELMKNNASAWQDYKFMNPEDQKIESKSIYLERIGDFIVGCGIYKE